MNELDASGRPVRRSGVSRLRRILAWIASLAAIAGTVVLVKKHAGPHREDEQSGRGSHGTPPSLEARHSGHETEDMSGRTMMWVLISLGGLVAVAIGLMVLLLGYFHQERSSAPPQLTAEQTAELHPPKPNLQTDPVGDLIRLRNGENQLLHGYSWLDPGRTRARIPIDRAVTLTVGQKLDPPP
jgi:hypothetical protein